MPILQNIKQSPLLSIILILVALNGYALEEKNMPCAKRKENSRQAHLRDTAIILLKQFRNFPTYQVKFIKTFRPLFSNPDHTDTIQINYHSESHKKNVEYFVNISNPTYHTFGFVKNDSCRIYHVINDSLSLQTIKCMRCNSWLENWFLEPRDAGDFTHKLSGNDTTYNISLDYFADTIKLKFLINREKYDNEYGIENYSREFYFDRRTGFLLKYFEHLEMNNDTQEDEYTVIKYSLDRDVKLDELLLKLLSTEPSTFSNEWLTR